MMRIEFLSKGITACSSSCSCPFSLLVLAISVAPAGAVDAGCGWKVRRHLSMRYVGLPHLLLLVIVQIVELDS